MDDNGTYLRHIYGIYKECITNISIDMYDIPINIHIKYIHQTHRCRLRRPPHWVCVSDDFLSEISMDTPYTFLIYSIYVSQICSMYFPLCVSSFFMESREDKSLSQNHVFIFIFSDFTPFIFLLIIS